MLVHPIAPVAGPEFAAIFVALELSRSNDLSGSARRRGGRFADIKSTAAATWMGFWGCWGGWRLEERGAPSSGPGLYLF